MLLGLQALEIYAYADEGIARYPELFPRKLVCINVRKLCGCTYNDVRNLVATVSTDVLDMSEHAGGIILKRVIAVISIV